VSEQGRERRSGEVRRKSKPKRDGEREAHPLQLMQALIGNRGVGELLQPSVQRMEAATSYDVPLPRGFAKGDKDEEESDSEDSSSSSESEQERKRRKKKEKKEKRRLKKEKKDKKRKKRRARSPSPDPRLQRNKEDLAKLVTGSYSGSVRLDAPVRRHSITEVTRDDIKGHNVFTTATADTVATMTAYRDRINSGDFDRCRPGRRKGDIEIEIDGRIFGCHDTTERAHNYLYPVDGPGCTGLSYEELECMCIMRDAKAVTDYINKWYKPGEIAQARKALLRAGINIP
jgi:hypothetical protein